MDTGRAVAALVNDLQLVRIPKQEGVPRLGAHLIPRCRRRIKSIDLGQRLHDLVAAVHRLAEIAFGEEPRRVHRTAADGPVRVDNQLIGIGLPQRPYAVASGARSRIDRWREVTWRCHRVRRLTRGTQPHRGAPAPRELPPRTLPHQRHTAYRTVTLPQPREEHSHMVQDLGRRPDCVAAAKPPTPSTIHSHGHAQAGDISDRSLRPLPRPLALVHGECLQETALRLRLQDVTHQTGFARP